MAMIALKNGVKNFSTAPQNEIQKVDKTSNISATDRARLSDEDIGAVLNKIADPNWVDQSKKIRAVGNDKLDKDAFMKLMLAQMKNQDPTNPMNSQEMAAQLATFSGVEQMQNMNSTLTEMKNAQKPTEGFAALQFIGKSVAGDSAKLVRAKGDKDHDFSFNLPDNAKEAVIKVRNEQGDIVRTVSLKDLKKGDNNWTWNGLNEQGNATPAGEYQFFIEASNAAGAKLAVKTDFEGLITGLNYTPEGPVLLVGTQSVKLQDVKKIVDPSLLTKGLSEKNNGPVNLKNQPGASETDIKNGENQQRAGDAAPVGTSQLLDNVGMSRGLISKVEKETK